MKSNKKVQFIIIFLVIFFMLGIFPFSIYLYSKYTEAINHRDRYITLQRELLEQLDNRINQIHHDIIKDLEFVLSSFTFSEFIENSRMIEATEKDWLKLSELKGRYDQIRFLDARGMEVIRINYNNGAPALVPRDQLQDKSNRYYFKNILPYGDRAIHVSYLDLNIENGMVEMPPKPMLRYSVPVFNRAGEFKGALVFNYLAEHMLTMLSEEIEMHNSGIYLMNPDGYFMAGTDKDRLWGFMYEDKKEETMFNKPFLPNSFDREITTINDQVFIQRKVLLSKSNSYKTVQMDLFWVLMTESRDVQVYYDQIIVKIFSSLWNIITIYLIVTLLVTYSLTYLINRVIMLKENRGILKKVMNEVVNALEITSILDDDDTGNHIRRVCEYSYILAKATGLSESTSREIQELAALHDIGKVGVHDSILKKCGPLEEEEWREMKRHVLYGSEVIKKTDLSPIASNIVLYHHENWDGSGYMSGCRGEDIPIEARIVSITDVYDALRNKKCYKAAMSHEEAIKIIRKEKGRKFDPELVTLFLAKETQINEISIKLK